MNMLSISHERIKFLESYKNLNAYISEVRRRPIEAVDFQNLENELHDYCVALECELLKDLLSKYDVDKPSITINNKTYYKAMRSKKLYQSGAGTIEIERHLYRSNRTSRTICPLEIRAGIVESSWTPRAAKHALHIVGEMTPYRAEKILVTLGNMRPSKSSLDRLPKLVNAKWEAQREEMEEALLETLKIPEDAVSMGVSLDGVMLPVRKTRFKIPGFQEASCGSITFYNKTGEPLITRQLGRMPEHKKATLKNNLTQIVKDILSKRPDLICIKVADGAKDNWEFLEKLLPESPQVFEAIDFYHASEHLKVAYDSVFGENSLESRCHYDKYRKYLLENKMGIDKVIRNLRYLVKKSKHRNVIKRELNYFVQNKKRMKYEELKNKFLPIGSGIVEATCKTLVQQRLKCSGMRWDEKGGQAILNIRSWLQSKCFDEAWNLLSTKYKTNKVTMTANDEFFLVAA